MGEYAQYQWNQIKIGTCESMYYLRYSDRNQVTPEQHSLNPAKELNLFWRIPFPDEDKNGPGNYDDYSRGYLLPDYPADDLADNPGSIQLSAKNGYLLSIPCYHGAKLPEIEGVRVHWNGKAHHIELAHLKNTENGILPVIRCKFCGAMWRCSWDEVLPYINDKELYARLNEYSEVAA